MKLISVYNLLLFWAEVWPLIIFLLIYFFTRQKNDDLKLLIIYLLITTLISIPANIISNFTDRVPVAFRNNSVCYNLLAFIKVIFIGIYIIRLKPMRQFRFTKPLLIFFLFFSIIDFILFEPPTERLGKYLYSAVSIILLVYCMTYFLTSIIDDDDEFNLKNPAFLVCSGIAIFESVNFFVYLFIYELYTTDITVSKITRDISNWTYIISYFLFIIAIYKNSDWRWKAKSNNKPLSYHV